MRFCDTNLPFFVKQTSVFRAMPLAVNSLLVLQLMRSSERSVCFSFAQDVPLIPTLLNIALEQSVPSNRSASKILVCTAVKTN